MKVKDVVVVLGALVAAFVYPPVTIWLVPLVIGLITLGKFGKQDVAKYIAFLSLKPIFIWFLLLLVADFDFFRRLYAPYSFAVVPELILTLVILYCFKHLFRRHKLAWLFLLGDVIRWLSLFIESLIPDPIPEPYFYTQFYVFFFFLLIFPSFYAVVGFLCARQRTLNTSAVP